MNETRRAWKELKYTDATQRQKDLLAAAWKRGNYFPILHPGQRRMWNFLENSTSAITISLCSRQYGKSTGGLASRYGYCYQNPGTLHFILGPTDARMQKIVREKKRYVEQFIPKHLRPKHFKSVIEFPNESLIYYGGADVSEGGAARGNTADSVLIDEAQMWRNLAEALNSGIIPTVTNTGGRVDVLGTAPASTTHDLIALIVEAIANDAFYQAMWYENPFLKPDFIINLVNTYSKGVDDPRFRREYMADWNVSDNERRVVPEFEEDAHTAFFEGYARSDRFLPVVGLDMANGQADTALLVGWYDFKIKAMVIRHEFITKDLSTGLLLHELKRIENRLWQKVDIERGVIMPPFRVCDLDHRFIIDADEGHGLHFEPVSKITHSLNGQSGRRQMADLLRDKFYEGRIRIHPECKKLTAQLKGGIWNKRGTDFDIASDGSHLDALAALQYLVITFDWGQIDQSRGKYYDRLRRDPTLVVGDELYDDGEDLFDPTWL